MTAATTFKKTIEALQSQESNHWAIADALLAEVTDTGKEWDQLQSVLAAQGIDYKVDTLKVYRRVAEQVPPSQRVKGVSFAAHQAAGPTGKPKETIEAVKASGARVTRETILSHVRSAKGNAGAPEKTDAVAAAWRDLVRGAEALGKVSEKELIAYLSTSDRALPKVPGLVSELRSLSLALATAEKKAREALVAAQAKTSAQSKSASSKPAPAKKAEAKKTAPAKKAAPTRKPLPETDDQGVVVAPKKPALKGLGAGRGQA